MLRARRMGEGGEASALGGFRVLGFMVQGLEGLFINYIYRENMNIYIYIYFYIYIYIYGWGKGCGKGGGLFFTLLGPAHLPHGWQWICLAGCFSVSPSPSPEKKILKPQTPNPEP